MMFKSLFTGIRGGALAVVAAIALAPQAQAATIDFVVDRAASSVQLISQSGGGRLCTATNCGVSVELASGLDSGDTYTIGTGVTETFDFLTFSGTGTTGLTPRGFMVKAVLAFSSPSISVTGMATGSAFLLAGRIIGGNLTWDSITPQNVVLPDGSEVAFNFGGGQGIFLSERVTTSASVEGLNIVQPAPVPVPAAGLLLAGALGGLALARRRKLAA
jgi:hypothetical protein